MSSAPTLLVLAAGMGSRYGGLKQVDPVGPSGETILDYAVFDAIREGFGRVVFVIRKEFEEAFRTQVAAKYADKVKVDYVFQALDALPPGFAVPEGREKPWGTGHAVWCARDAVTEPFAVIGADDFFGRDAFRQLALFLREGAATEIEDAAPNFAMIGYRLANTLSENGAVSRGVCATGGDGYLEKVVEHTGIRREEVAATATGDADAEKKYTGEETVSMNCWAFTPEFFTGLNEQFEAFLEARGAEMKSEFYLPEAVSEQVAEGLATVEVRTTSASWFGVTYREDKPRVQVALAELVAGGDYPAQLFPVA
ncbi:nucleotidyltransferase family protein [Rariglobus hedericola]|uniref:Nucleotidyltransferase n=1 Tax=Rariglobus hedericola TaxID=2597822 RepID=A0A556QJF6_9BACT|nr:sugar phosphate nucleotidyltransferase [Rariglobus hedericola]TSJ76783.1 nucleotidyltransferase [Rariglobus hedericola]